MISHEIPRIGRTAQHRPKAGPSSGGRFAQGVRQVRFFAGTTKGNKVDAKGRVSVPASFRKVLGGQEFQGVYVFPSHRQPCLEACGEERMNQLVERIQQLDEFSEEREIWEEIVFGSAEPLSFDGTGRIMLPREKMDHAGITDAATFAGRGDSFQIWEPSRHEEHARSAQQIASERKMSLASPAKRESA